MGKKEVDGRKWRWKGGSGSGSEGGSGSECRYEVEGAVNVDRQSNNETGQDSTRQDSTAHESRTSTVPANITLDPVRTSAFTQKDIDAVSLVGTVISDITIDSELNSITEKAGELFQDSNLFVLVSNQ